MLKRLFKRTKKQKRVLDAMQVEVASVCNMKCTFCPTTHITQNNSNDLMPLNLYKKLTPYFSWTSWVYLQGWGEPMLNPNLWDMAKIAKEAGATVGMTTNATLFSDDNIKNIIDSGVDMVSVSVAGVENHNSLRVGSDLSKLQAGIAELIKARDKNKSSNPQVKLSYMMTKDSIQQLPEAVAMAAKLKVDEVYAINQDYVYSWEANESKIFSWTSEPNMEYQQIVETAKKKAKKVNLQLRTYPLSIDEIEPVCQINPNKFVFITATGDVTPCTCLGREENPRVFKDNFYKIPRKSFGNIKDTSFEEIWEDASYISFREKFAKREESFKKLLRSYTDGDPSLIKMKQADETHQKELEQTPLPKECVTCTKAFGF
ncbi:MoaA/NifB/PqqE/SkfB family radical SAM enzyme [Desulfitispora alkaliphila]|uniref:radical SAM protein n=1 Tax=Desulfitispora alkaliphila TaxID=622674 RepID=UPI003D257828